MKAIVIIADGLGIGEVPDVPVVRPQDKGANTLGHIADLASGPKLQLPVLEAMGLGNLGNFNGIRPVGEKALAGYGRCMLAHQGADTYMGHQELMGSKPAAVSFQTMQEVGLFVMDELQRNGHSVEIPLSGNPSLLVDNCIVVADNMEADPGQNINVTGSLDIVSFDCLVRIGMLVRKVVQVSRVIVVGGKGFDTGDILAHMKASGKGTWGVDTPGLGVYDENYRVRHLGFNVTPDLQMPTIAARSGFDVVLGGKAADIVECEAAVRNPVIDTDGVFDFVHKHLHSAHDTVVIANIQETDLAGHQQSVDRYRSLLKTIDRRIGQIIRLLEPADILIFTADHGNDPLIGHSRHTREMTPFLVVNPQLRGVDLGIRSTLADVAASVCDAIGVKAPEFGTSCLERGQEGNTVIS